LLAALLQTVRLQAVPHWWNMGGIRFRLRLLWYHWYRYWPPVLLIMLFVALFTGLEYRHNHGVPSALGDLSKPLTIDFWIGQLSTAKTDAPRVGLLLSLLTGLTVLWKGLTAFGVNPASLLTTISQGNKIKDLDAQTSFRQKFAVEFKDVTRALGERSMLVFIDDLDRCRPENVRDLLEAVNFMVSSGECFVVMGMARETVEHCVGLSFKDVAEEMVDDPHVSSGPPYDALDAAKRKRTEFARQYLDKLVNIEVPLPSPNNDQSRKLFIPDQPPQERAVQRRVRRTMAIAKRVMPVVMAMLLIAGGFELGLYLESSSPQAAINQQFNIPSQPGGTTGTPVLPPTPVKVAIPKIAKLKVPNDPRPELWVMAWPVYFMLATMVAAFYWALTRKPDLVVKDSVVFSKALEIWYPLVVARQRTPRSVKRFMNRLRYLAMRQRTTRAGYPLWKTFVFRNSLLARLAKWLRVPEPTPVSNPETPMPEAILVAVAAIDQLEPEWISDEDAFRAVAVGNVPAREEVAGTGQLMRDAIKKHNEQFSNWSNVATYRQKFLDLCANVTVR